MLMGPQATRGLEAPPPGPPLPEGASAGAGQEELRGREEVPRRGHRRVQPVFRIIYTAQGEPRPRKAAPWSLCASEGRGQSPPPAACKGNRDKDSKRCEETIPGESVGSAWQAGR